MSSETASEHVSRDPLIGATLGGKYTIRELIGRGGMGLVYLADAVDGGAQVVIKVLAPHIAHDEAAVARFEREGKHLSGLRHPNIVELFEVGRHEEQGYIAMEYLQGESLRRYIDRKTRLTLKEFVPIAAQVLIGAGYAHDRGMMLRDIKPSNIMLCERRGQANYVKMLDFGLAQLVDAEETSVAQAHVVGTTGYLAPEQIKGDPCDVRADVYALGVLFFRMLSGTSPIVGDNDGAVLYNHVHGTPIALKAVLPDDHGIPDKLIELVHRCLQKAPSQRPDDACQVAEMLFDCVEPELFQLPKATEATRAAARAYRERRQLAQDDERSSAEWTRPVLKQVQDDSPSSARSGSKATTDSDAELLRASPNAANDAGGARQGASDSTVVKRAKVQTRPKPKGEVRAEGAPAMSALPRPVDVAASRAISVPVSSSSGSGPVAVERASSQALPVPRDLRVRANGSVRAQRADSPTSGRPAKSSRIPSRVPVPHPAKVSSRPTDPSSSAPTTVDATPSQAVGAQTDDALPVSTEAGPSPSQAVAAKSKALRRGPPPVPPEVSQAIALAPTREPDEAEPNSGETGAPVAHSSESTSGPVIPAPRPPDELQPHRAARGVRSPAALAVGGLLVVIVGAVGAFFYSAPADRAAQQMPVAVAGVVPGHPSGVLESAPAVASVELGRLRVAASAGAVVFIDGADRGSAPFDGEITPGKHQISVVADGFRPWQKTVEIINRQTTQLDVELVRLPSRPRAGRPGRAGARKPGEAPLVQSTLDAHGRALPTMPNPFDSPGASMKGSTAAESSVEAKSGKNGKEPVFIGRAGDSGEAVFLPVGEK